MWLQFYTRQTMAVLMGGLEDAFAFFGGVPAELLFDQMKSVIIDDERAIGGKLLENAEFVRFAAHWGFRIRACRPYRAKTKGKVERPIGYARQSFFYGRNFLNDADLNAQALSWMEHTANVRVHRTTAEVPRVRFERDKRDFGFVRTPFLRSCAIPMTALRSIAKSNDCNPRSFCMAAVGPIGDRWLTRSRPAHRNLDLRLLRNLQSIVDLDSEIPHGAFELVCPSNS